RSVLIRPTRWRGHAADGHRYGSSEPDRQAGLRSGSNLASIGFHVLPGCGPRVEVGGQTECGCVPVCLDGVLTGLLDHICRQGVRCRLIRDEIAEIGGLDTLDR